MKTLAERLEDRSEARAEGERIGREDAEQAARLLRQFAHERQQTNGRWSSEEQVMVDLAIRFEHRVRVRSDLGPDANPDAAFLTEVERRAGASREEMDAVLEANPSRRREEVLSTYLRKIIGECHEEGHTP